jgi:glycosyltransferase involved in cell wall biosynthesis
MSGRAALAAGRPLRLPLVYTFHALGVVKRRHQGAKDTSPPSRIREEALLAREADRIVATCSDEVFELVRVGADLRHITVVPCGVDLGLFRPDGPAEPSPAGRHRLLVVSRLVERKGIGNAITALAGLPATELVVAGGPPADRLSEDPEARRLAALAAELGVTDRVRLRGRVERRGLAALYRSADVVVCVPWYEPFGLVPLEAMACGVPVVATAVGGLVDSVVDGVTGLHVPPRRPDALRSALARLLSDEARRAAFGTAGARRARRRFGWDRIARSTLDVYTGVAAAPADTWQVHR